MAMSILNGILRDLYMVFLILAVWEAVFGHDLLYPPVRLVLIGVTILLMLIIPYKSFSSSGINDQSGRVLRRNNQMGQAGLPKTDKMSTSGKIRNMDYCRSEMQGWRPAMEDAAAVDEFLDGAVPALRHWSFFGIFDGHGGSAVSKKLSTDLSTHFYEVCAEKHRDAEELGPKDVEYALGEAFARMDLALRKSAPGGEFDFVGSTAVVVLVSDTALVCANVGDSRAILCRDGVAAPLSDDHKPELASERRRIERAGGSVAQIGPCWRVDGWGLNLSRAFGDFHYKQRGDLEPWEQKVSAEPEIRIVELAKESDSLLIMACDGCFELLKNQDVIDFVYENVKKPSSTLQTVVEKLLSECISPNLLVTQGKGGDNVSAILVKLPNADKVLERASAITNCGDKKTD